MTKVDDREVYLTAFGKKWLVDLDENSEVYGVHVSDGRHYKPVDSFILDMLVWDAGFEEWLKLSDVLQELARDVPLDPSIVIYGAQNV